MPRKREKSREELLQQKADLMRVYDKVRERLMKYPNVVNVGIGMKMKGGVLTDEPAITVVVTEKKDEGDLAASEVIPKEVEGIRTDVVVQPQKRRLSSCTEERGSHRPILGGIQINNFRNGSGEGGSGTLGCLAQRVSDGAWVILSNHHVLYGDNGQDGDEIGQPAVGCSWCCKTNVIARNLDKDEDLDCAIARVEDDVAIENRIRVIGDIRVLGAASALPDDWVRKVGATTGLTSGDVSFIDPANGEIWIAPRSPGGPAHDPGGCSNFLPGGDRNFAWYGDSGSVVVNGDGEVIGLLYAIDDTGMLGFAHDIIRIQNRLNIAIRATHLVPGRSPIAMSVAARESSGPGHVDPGWVETVEARLAATPAGGVARAMMARHEEEVLALVNGRRPVTVVWQRRQGPAFLAALGRSVRHPGYRIPREINRVSIENLLMSMAVVLEEHGSEALRRDIRRWSLDVIAVCSRCETADDLFAALEDLPVHEGARTPVLTA